VADLELGVLDQSPIPSGSTAVRALAETLELARVTERLGYSRYWVAEHHGSESFAGSSPEILVGRIASVTARIRVGTAGVMLMHYSPLKVAESFKVLEALFPGRIDLGIGRAPGSDGLTAAALAYGSKIGAEYLPAKLADLASWLADETPYTGAFAPVVATPKVPGTPELWMLGSTEDGARLAAHFGLPFSFAHFINPDALESSVSVYREQFQPTRLRPFPVVNVGVFALCADTHEEAELLARSRDVWRVKVHKGDFGPIPSIEEALAYPMTPEEERHLESRRQHQILGTRDEVAAQLRALAARVDATGLAIVSITHDFRARTRCYELIADALLTPPPARSPAP
jgi:luciferase family oxidoreductase group 1